MRRGEVLGLRWEEVDFERTCLRLRDSKTGPKVLPLNAPTLEILARLHAIRSIAVWRLDYNRHRPHSALGGLTPEEFAQQAA